MSKNESNLSQKTTNPIEDASEPVEESSARVPETSEPIVLTCWGSLARWPSDIDESNSVTSPIPSPGDMREVLSNIYSESNGFFWQIKKIEVLKPFEYYLLHYDYDEYDTEGTRLNNVFLKNACYRVTAEMVFRFVYTVEPQQLYEEALKAIKAGENTFNPYLVDCEYFCHYKEGSTGVPPIPETVDFGLSLYDAKNLDIAVENPIYYIHPTYYHAKMERGVIQVPPYDSPMVVEIPYGD